MMLGFDVRGVAYAGGQLRCGGVAMPMVCLCLAPLARHEADSVTGSRRPDVSIVDLRLKGV